VTAKAGPALPTLPAYIDHYAALAPDLPALLTDAGPVSYRALADAIDRSARALLAAGVAPGDRVGLLSTPRPVFVASYLAATKLGAIWFGLNPRYTVPEMAYVLGDAEPRLVLSIEEFEGRMLADDLRQAASDAGQAHAVHVLGPADPLQLQGPQGHRAARPAADAAEREDRQAPPPAPRLRFPRPRTPAVATQAAAAPTPPETLCAGLVWL
jgi:acyl-CoA synthetase (AMP-forming)/AMP-acid ligase II